LSYASLKASGRQAGQGWQGRAGQAGG